MSIAVLNSVMDFLRGARNALRERFDRSPVGTVEAAVHFVRTRAAYVAQTSLYGYLKTRMGTQYRDLFQDDVMAPAIADSARQLFVSAMGDLAVFCVAVAVRTDGLRVDEAPILAAHCFASGLALTLDGPRAEEIRAAAESGFAARLARTDWEGAAAGDTAFAGSIADLIRVAPVIDDFKESDEEIVSNSIRFRWRDVREQWRNRLDAASLAEDWRGRDGAVRLARGSLEAEGG